MLQQAPEALRQMAGQDDPPPRLLFPPDGARLQIDDFSRTASGLSLSAQGRALHWYVDGSPIETSNMTGQTLWRPPTPGFYRLSVVDGAGRKAVARIQVEK